MSFECYDPLIKCPYDICHRVRRSRMSIHLMKCSRRHPDARKKTCLYNKSHVIDASDYDFHVEHCADSVDQYSTYSEKSEQKRSSLPPSSTKSHRSLNRVAENWEEDTRVCSYNQWGKDKPFIRTLIAGSKGEKKKFRDLEIKRVQRIEEIEKQKKERQKEEEKKAATTPSKFEDLFSDELKSASSVYTFEELDHPSSEHRSDSLKYSDDSSDEEIVLRRPRKQSLSIILGKVE